MRDPNGAPSPPRRSKLLNLLRHSHSEEDDSAHNDAGAASPVASPGYASDRNPLSAGTSPYSLSPWNPAVASPFAKSPWTHLPGLLAPDEGAGAGAGAPAEAAGLVGSLVREEGHVYSLAAAGDLLYTGSDSRNIRVWKDGREFAGFKSSSGLVKAIVIHGDRIFTGHQDGKIRVWRVSPKDPVAYKRVGTLPKMKDFLKSSVNPSNYVEVRRHRNAVWIRHFDAVSCLSLDEGAGLLYSGSWDKTVKVWRVSDSRCLESVSAHDDAVNAVAVGGEGLVFTGSADGTVKVWRREAGRGARGGGEGGVRHVEVKTLLEGESAVTALAVAREAGLVYCGASDGAVNYWDCRKRMAHGGVLRGHKMAVLCLAAAGRLVVSGSADKTLCVWRREEVEVVGRAHVRLAVLVGHAGPIKCVALEEDRDRGRGRGLGRERGDGPDGAARRWLVYSGSLDRSVKVWRVWEDAGDALERADPRAWRLPAHVLGNAKARQPDTWRPSSGAGPRGGYGLEVGEDLRGAARAHVRAAA